MPIYEYKHLGDGCGMRGDVFEIYQGIKDAPLEVCPDCGRPVKRMISLANVNTPVTDSKYKEMGFTKLVRKDKGIYENVTAMDDESRYFEADKPETMPDLKRRITD